MRHLHLVDPTQETGVPEPEFETEPPYFDERFGISLFGRSYYINLRIGAELRSKERRKVDGQVRISGVAFFYCLICTAAIMLFGTLCILYLLKSGAGINLSDGQSILHPLYAIATGE